MEQIEPLAIIPLASEEVKSVRKSARKNFAVKIIKNNEVDFELKERLKKEQ